MKKVYLNEYSTKRHSIYEELINSPPKGYEYIYETKRNISTESFRVLKNSKISVFLKPIRVFVSPVQILQFINRLKKLPSEIKLVHSADTIFQKKYPWAGDLECIGSYLGHSGKMSWFKKRKIEKFLSSKYCKKIMPFTEYGMQTLKESLNTKNFENKIEVVHFAADIPKTLKKKKFGKIKLIFVGSANHQNPIALYSKGAREIIEAFKILNKKYSNLELIMLTKLPEKMQEEVSQIKNIKVLFMPRQETFKIYAESDIFIFPTFLFPGLSYVEAMGSGLPIITTDLFGNKELVENGKNGFLISIPDKLESMYRYGSVPINKMDEYIETMSQKNGKAIIDGIVEHVSKFAENPQLIKKMGKFSRKKYEKEFSIESRNKKLKEIFDSLTN